MEFIAEIALDVVYGFLKYVKDKYHLSWWKVLLLAFLVSVYLFTIVTYIIYNVDYVNFTNPR
jgi:hypothetical protein